MISAMVRYRGLGNLVAQLQSRQQFYQVGVLVDRHLMFPSDRKNRLGQLIVTLGAEGSAR